MAEPSSAWTAILSSVASVLNAITWPAVAVWFLSTHRARVGFLLDVLGRRMSTAKEIEAGPFKVTNEEELIMGAVDSARSQAGIAQAASTAASKPLQDADRQLREAAKDATSLDEKLLATNLSESGAKYAARRALFALADEYDEIRSEMPSGHKRTTRMNEIVAGMRTLAFEGLWLRTELTKSESVGKRLAAICMLQIEPRPRYFRWLVERVKTETQAFVLFQAALAILEHVKKGFYINPEDARSEIKEAIRVVSSFAGGRPDQNTLDALNEALAMVN
jgi:hypothetical protein